MHDFCKSILVWFKYLSHSLFKFKKWHSYFVQNYQTPLKMHAHKVKNFNVNEFVSFKQIEQIDT